MAVAAEERMAAGLREVRAIAVTAPNMDFGRKGPRLLAAVAGTRTAVAEAEEAGVEEVAGTRVADAVGEREERVAAVAAACDRVVFGYR